MLTWHFFFLLFLTHLEANKATANSIVDAKWASYISNVKGVILFKFVMK